MSERGIRNNTGKPQWSQVDFKSLEPMVRVLEYGEKRVGKSNWRKGLLVNEVCESLLRHIFAYMDGEDDDKESGLPHVGHILSNAMFLSHMHLFRPDMDNRGKKEGKPKEKFNVKKFVHDRVMESLLQQDEIMPEKGFKAVLDKSNSRQVVEDFANRLNDDLNAKVGSKYPKEKSIPFKQEDVIKNNGSWKDLVSSRMMEPTMEVTLSDGTEWIMTRK